jgi:Tol biopolymer transport system component
MFTRLVNNVWAKPEVASFAGNFSFEPFVTPDNKRIYFQTGKVSQGQMLMYSLPVNIPFSTEYVNDEPNLSPDGKYIFFSRNDDIYWVSAKIIEDLRPKDYPTY